MMCGDANSSFVFSLLRPLGRRNLEDGVRESTNCGRNWRVCLVPSFRRGGQAGRPGTAGDGSRYVGSLPRGRVYLGTARRKYLCSVSLPRGALRGSCRTKQ